MAVSQISVGMLMEDAVRLSQTVAHLVHGGETEAALEGVRTLEVLLPGIERLRASMSTVGTVSDEPEEKLESIKMLLRPLVCEKADDILPDEVWVGVGEITRDQGEAKEEGASGGSFALGNTGRRGQRFGKRQAQVLEGLLSGNPPKSRKELTDGIRDLLDNPVSVPRTVDVALDGAIEKMRTLWNGEIPPSDQESARLVRAARAKFNSFERFQEFVAGYLSKRRMKAWRDRESQDPSKSFTEQDGPNPPCQPQVVTPFPMEGVGGARDDSAENRIGASPEQPVAPPEHEGCAGVSPVREGHPPVMIGLPE